jgi:alpha-beta hydrolase superfamily lysophospholipase
MGRVEISPVPSSDGRSRLRVLRWLPDTEKPLAVVQIAHGVTEHIGRYDAFAQFLADRGYVAAGNSHIGHGAEADETCSLGIFPKNGWDCAVRDLKAVHDLLRRLYPHAKHFLLGHSMGSFLARTFMIDYPELLSGCIVLGSGQQVKPLLLLGRALAAVQTRLFGRDRPFVGLNRLCFKAYNRRISPLYTPCDWLSRDKSEVGRFIDDEISGFVLTHGLFSQLLHGISYVGRRENVRKMRRDIPILLASGEEDPVGDYGHGVRRVYRLWQRAGLSGVTLRLYPGARHELLSETTRQSVWEDIYDWMESVRRQEANGGSGTGRL